MDDLEQAKQNLEELENNEEVAKLKATIENLKSELAQKEETIQEFSKINQKLFLRLGEATNEGDVELSEDEKENNDLIDSITNKINLVNGG